MISIRHEQNEMVEKLKTINRLQELGAEFQEGVTMLQDWAKATKLNRNEETGGTGQSLLHLEIINDLYETLTPQEIHLNAATRITVKNKLEDWLQTKQYLDKNIFPPNIKQSGATPFSLFIQCRYGSIHDFLTILSFNDICIINETEWPAADL